MSLLLLVIRVRRPAVVHLLPGYWRVRGPAIIAVPVYQSVRPAAIVVLGYLRVRLSAVVDAVSGC